MTAPTITADTITEVIRACRFTYRSEDELQEGLTAALAAAGLPVHREVRLSRIDRVDLLIDHIGVEVKLAGAAADVGRQLLRYAHSDQVTELVLVTTRARHRTLPDQVGGKPLTVCVLGGVG